MLSMGQSLTQLSIAFFLPKLGSFKKFSVLNFLFSPFSHYLSSFRAPTLPPRKTPGKSSTRTCPRKTRRQTTKAGHQTPTRTGETPTKPANRRNNTISVRSNVSILEFHIELSFAGHRRPIPLTEPVFSGFSEPIVFSTTIVTRISIRKSNRLHAENRVIRK